MIGLSGGSRSKPCFDWVRNLLRKNSQDQIDAYDAKQCSAFAFFWNLLRHRLPKNILENFRFWMDNDMMPRMSPEWKKLAKTGSYSIDLPGQHYTFENVELAPPAGVMAHNYSRYGLLQLMDFELINVY